MPSYIYIVIFTEIFLVCATILSLPCNDKSNNLIFQISFALTFFVVAIKYYFSSDISTYVPHYENLSSLPHLTIKEIKECHFEPGYTIFCSIIKTFGFSFWMMTATITILLMHSLYGLLKLVPQYRTIGLMIFFIIGWDLLLQQYRQALAVAFFFYAIANFANGKSPVKTLALSLISCFFHNSAIFLVLPFIICSGLCTTTPRIKRSAFVLLFIIFIVSLFTNLGWIVEQFAKSMDLSATEKYSLSYHFGTSKVTQSIILLYLSIYLILSILHEDRTDRITLTFRFITYIGLAYIALFYKYHLFTNRFSNYFAIIALLYSLDLLRYNLKGKHVNCKLAYQFLSLMIIFFSAYKVLPQALILPESVLYKNTPTVLSTIFLNESETKRLQQEQMEKAAYFWNNELSGMYDNSAKSFNFSNK